MLPAEEKDDGTDNTRLDGRFRPAGGGWRKEKGAMSPPLTTLSLFFFVISPDPFSFCA
jgi:hypothetical protein